MPTLTTSIQHSPGSPIQSNQARKRKKTKQKTTVHNISTVSNVSFFNFCIPRDVPERGHLDAAAESILAADFEISHFLHERIIPRLVLYFTGETIEDDDGDDYNEEGEEMDKEG